MQNKKLTPAPSEKGAEDTFVEPLQEDADEDLTPVDESKVSVEKGSPPPEPVPTQNRSALGLERNKAITAGERPQFIWNLGGWAPQGFRLLRQSDFAYGKTEKDGWTLVLMMRTLFTPATTLLRWKTSPLVHDNS